MYANGRGVSQNDAEAARWLHLAAEQGHPNAQINLGIMYKAGFGVATDLVQAHKWFNLAATRASDQEVRRKAVRHRDQVASLLSSVDLTEAQRLAAEWWARQSATQ